VELPPLPSTPSWRGAQLKHRVTFTFYLYLTQYYVRLVFSLVLKRRKETLFFSFLPFFTYSVQHEIRLRVNLSDRITFSTYFTIDL
jgi:hypothetical protein